MLQVQDNQPVTNSVFNETIKKKVYVISVVTTYNPVNNPAIKFT